MESSTAQAQTVEVLLWGEQVGNGYLQLHYYILEKKSRKFI